MRFESQTQNIGESELRPERVAEGVYRVSGANLSATGAWRIRITIQRPNQYDTLLDFNPTVFSAPTNQTPIPLPEANTPMSNRILVLIITGVAALGVGGYFLGENRERFFQSSSLLAISLILVGGLFLFSAIQGVSTASAKDATFAPSPKGSIYINGSPNQRLP